MTEYSFNTTITITRLFVKHNNLGTTTGDGSYLLLGAANPEMVGVCHRDGGIGTFYSGMQCRKCYVPLRHFWWWEKLGVVLSCFIIGIAETAGGS